VRGRIICVNYPLQHGKTERLFATRIGPYAPYQVEVYNGSCRFVPTDTDTYIRADYACPTKYRFNVGQYIEFLDQARKWTRGKIVMVHYPLPHPSTSGFAAYQIQTFGLERDLVYITKDSEDCIRFPVDVTKKKKKWNVQPPSRKPEDRPQIPITVRDKIREQEELMRLNRLRKHEELVQQKQRDELDARLRRRELAEETKLLNSQRRTDMLQVRADLHDRNAFLQRNRVRVKKTPDRSKKLDDDTHKTESLRAQAQHYSTLRENEAARIADAERRMEFIELADAILTGD